MLVRSISLLIFSLGALVGQESSLQTEIERHVRATLEASVRNGSRTELVAAHLGNGAYLAPFLLNCQEDEVLGVAALTQWIRIAGRDRTVLRAGLLTRKRTDAPFLAEAARAVANATPPYSASEWVASELASLGQTARHLALHLSGPADQDLVLNLISDPNDELAVAAALAFLRQWPSRWGELLVLPDRARLSVSIFAAWLDAATAADVAAFVDRRWGEGSAALTGEDARSFSARGRAALASEWFARPPDASRSAALAALLDLTPGLSDADLARYAWTHPDLFSNLDAAIRVTEGVDADRAELAKALPLDPPGTISEAEAFHLLRRARPAWAGFLSRHLDSVEALRRPEFALGLARLGHPAGSVWLDGALSHFDPAVRAAAFTARALVGGGLKPFEIEAALRQSDPAVRSAALLALESTQGSIDPELAVALLPDLFEDDAQCLRQAMARHPDRARVRGLLFDLLATDQPLAETDELAAWLLNLDPTERAQIALSAVGPEQRTGMRVQAILALAPDLEHGDTRLVKQMESLAKDENQNVRAAAAEALGRTDHDLARAALIHLARDPEALVRWCAVSSLARRDRFHIVPILREAARDPDGWVSTEAALALLGNGGEDEARRLLRSAADDPVFRGRVVQRVGDALGRSGATLEDLWQSLGMDLQELAR